MEEAMRPMDTQVGEIANAVRRFVGGVVALTVLTILLLIVMVLS